MESDERKLADGCREGDTTARRELYTRYGGRLLSVCLRYAGDRATAEDLLHDAFLKIYGAFDRFTWRGEGSLRAWMERIAVNVALEWLRARRRIDFAPVDERMPDAAEPAPDDVERIPPGQLTRLIAGLPDGYRTVFNLYCIEGRSHREIAEMLGINEKSSSSQLFRAKAMLARRIDEYMKKER